ncbi:MAG: TolC family protein [Bryobacteraceae bacterium]|nr:TolC family protein [Bryobacterales bacterium]NUM99957.1 TolC family protein [Bryobacteraceae bacterium]
MHSKFFLFLVLSGVPLLAQVGATGVPLPEINPPAMGSSNDAPLFPTPAYFRKHFSTPPARVELRPPVRLDDFVVGDRLELSLRSFLDLVMANNTDIEIQRVSMETLQNAIQRAFGTFDPRLVATFQSQRTKTQTGDVLAGAATLSELSQPARFSYSQTLDTGTQFNIGFNATKRSTNNTFANFNPLLNAQFGMDFVQPLLRNRGRYMNRMNITIARSRLRQGEYNLEDQVLRLIVQAENAYWQVVLDRENLQVQEKALAVNEQFLKRNERELELGAISPLDIYQPQARFQQFKIQVSQAQYRLEQSIDALRRQIGADMDPRFRKMPIVLTESVEPPLTTGAIDAENAVEKALRFRQDLKATAQGMDINDLQIKQSSNQLLPDLSLTGSYTSTGRGGIFYDRKDVFTEAGGASHIVKVIPGGFGDAMSQVFGFGYPIYSFGLRLTLPIRDRAASANLADAMVNKRLTALRARSLEQQIRQEVLNAVSQVESSKASVDLAKVQLQLAQQTLDAENKKYELGTNTIFFVLDAQQQLVQAQSQLVQQTVQYRRNLLNLLQRTGELLDERGIAVR